jgi:hypothetical protein
MGDLSHQRRFMDIHENKKGDTASKPEAGARDPKAKGAQREESPARGRNRVPNTEHEIRDAKENKTSQEKVRVEQGGKSSAATPTNLPRSRAT